VVAGNVHVCSAVVGATTDAASATAAIAVRFIFVTVRQEGVSKIVRSKCLTGDSSPKAERVSAKAERLKTSDAPE
jgi:hypothetical protein